MQYFLKWYNQVQSYFWRYWHLLRDTSIITQLAVWATGIRHTRNRRPVAICYPLVCKERFVLVKSDCRYPLQLIHKCCGPNVGNVRYIQTEKFVIEVAYRETRPPFWDALISRYRRPMTNGAHGATIHVHHVRVSRRVTPCVLHGELFPSTAGCEAIPPADLTAVRPSVLQPRHHTLVHLHPVVPHPCDGALGEGGFYRNILQTDTSPWIPTLTDNNTTQRLSPDYLRIIDQPVDYLRIVSFETSSNRGEWQPLIAVYTWHMYMHVWCFMPYTGGCGRFDAFSLLDNIRVVVRK